MRSDIVKAAYNYDLPRRQIAQRPVVPYDQARMLIANRETSSLHESFFSELDDYLTPTDILVFNNSRVIPARLFGTFSDNGAAAEIILHRKNSTSTWRCLGRPLKKFKEGRLLSFNGGLRARVLERFSAKEVFLEFFSDNGDRHPDQLLNQSGTMPIPPYIRNGHGDDRDVKDYQSIFAEFDGSVAAPTASLHFTASLLKKITSLGCQLETLTLHVGTASFLPLWTKDQADDSFQAPGSEAYIYSHTLLENLRSVREKGGRIIAVGTTVVRALESMAASPELAEGAALETELFIQPGYKFQLVDALITNFHQPRTTHLLLVQALMGLDLLRQSYSYALEREFRFLSYGDGMLIL